MLNGYVTKIGGIGAILTGLGILATGFAAGDYSRLTEGLTIISGGFVALGIGRKVQNLLNKK